MAILSDGSVPEKAMFDDAKAGDRVWDFALGHGTIESIKKDTRYPIEVAFEEHNGFESFTLHGERTPLCNPTLFWDEVKIVPPERPKEKCEACYRIKITKEGEVYNGYQNDLFLLSHPQHHTCERKL